MGGSTTNHRYVLTSFYHHRITQKGMIRWIPLSMWKCGNPHFFHLKKTLNLKSKNCLPNFFTCKPIINLRKQIIFKSFFWVSGFQTMWIYAAGEPERSMHPGRGKGAIASGPEALVPSNKQMSGYKGYGMWYLVDTASWMWPPHSNSGKWRFIGIPY